MKPDEGHLPPALRGLLRPDAYPHPVDGVELRETHVSWVFLAGPHAYKLKKPVALGFVDFSTFDRRAENCERELRLNRRLAPDAYLGVVDVVERDGLARIGGPGRVLERAVWMRRLPADGMLSALLARGAATAGLVRRIARTIARFHASAPTGPGVDEHGSLDNIAAHCRGNFDEVSDYVDVTIPRWELGAIQAYVERTLRDRRDLFDRRVAEGRIRDGHGDLHADSICLVDGHLVVFDCLEFDDSYRCGDVAAEVAFLAMDLDHAGRADLGWVFVDEYVRRSGDAGLLELLDFYKSYRAFVRGKVLSVRLAEAVLSTEERRAIEASAHSYFDLAMTYASGIPRPLLVVTSGLPGTGKTTLARALARRLGMVHVSTDVVRKRLAGMAPTERVPVDRQAELYGAEMTRRTYAALRAEASRWLRRGISVILDGTFTDPRQRRLVRRLADRRGAAFLMVVTTADEETIRRRLDAREADPTNVSDATWAVYETLRTSYAIPTDLPPKELLVDATGGGGGDAVIEHLAARQGSPAPDSLGSPSVAPHLPP